MHLCIFSGSNPGNKSAYLEAATRLGRTLAREGIGIVYGGASVGLMGAMADAALAEGGKVTGIITRALVEKEIAHSGLSDLRIVESMHQRKSLMSELSDGFIALPGGIGTLEELFEVWTWAQLGYHPKPCALLNIAKFYDGLSLFLNHITQEEFMKPEHRDMLIMEENIGKLLVAIRTYRAPQVTKWIRTENI